MVLAAAAKVGVTDYTWLPLHFHGRLDGEPWIDGIAVAHPSRSVHKLTRMLQVACYVVIAFLSGMRDAETKHLRRGCLRVQRDPDGRPYRWKLAGLAFKGEPSPAGTPATWVVGQPAARAIAVLEKLQPPGQPLLFGHLPHAPGGIAASPTRALTTKATNAQLAEFAPGSTTTAPSSTAPTPSPWTPPGCPPASSAARWPGSSPGVPAARSPARSSTGT
jgi:hypothetical protein